MGTYRRLALIGFAAFFSCSVITAGAENDFRMVPIQAEHGPSLLVIENPPGPASDGDVTDPGVRDYTLLWQRTLTDAIYTTAGMVGYSYMAFAGTYLNPPREVEAIPWVGDGTPAWVYPGTEFYADASQQAEVMAALDYTATDSTVTVREWRETSSNPVWSYPIRPWP